MTTTRAAPVDADEPLVDAAFLALADGAPVAWRDMERGSADAAQLEALRLLEDVAGAYRGDARQAAPEARPVLFRWGALEIEAPLGAGSYGEVFRAFDPWLGRHVALKLFRAGADAGLEEARRLARLRHRNVLSVYGCAIHDGRAGLWSELIDGRTLGALLADEGALSAEEGIRIGGDLAHALAMVHAAGLVHGDVKADNVMRERGGRIVLMDFGAGGEARLLAGRRLISGTPRYLPPEVLDGAPLAASSDIYAVGVLLFLLLAGRYPYAETEPVALREAQRRGAPDLEVLRPELATPLCGLVASCLATDAAQRPSAHALAAQLAQLGRHPGAAPVPRRRAGWIVASAAVLLVGVVLAWPYAFAPDWTSTAKFLRVESGGNVELAANSTLRPGDRVRLSLDSTRSAWVYVLNEDAQGNATVLLPGADDAKRGPLSTAAMAQLPGGQGSTLAWEVTADSAAEEFVVVAALQRVPELEESVAAWRRAAAAERTRSVGAVVDVPAPELRGARLREIVAMLERDPRQVRVWQFRFPHHD
jgi:hypothetical protein